MFPKAVPPCRNFLPLQEFLLLPNPTSVSLFGRTAFEGAARSGPLAHDQRSSSQSESQMVWPDAEERWATFQAVDIEPRYSDTVDPTNCAERVPTIIGNHSVYGAIHQQSEWRV